MHHEKEKKKEKLEATIAMVDMLNLDYTEYKSFTLECSNGNECQHVFLSNYA